jgi:hypothetical protein
MLVDGEFRRSKAVGGTSFHFNDDEGRAIPGDEVEVSVEALGAPATGDDGVVEGAEVEEGGIFAAFTEEQMWREFAAAVGEGAEAGVEAAFDFEGKVFQTHACSINCLCSAG